MLWQRRTFIWGRTWMLTTLPLDNLSPSLRLFGARVADLCGVRKKQSWNVVEGTGTWLPLFNSFYHPRRKSQIESVLSLIAHATFDSVVRGWVCSRAQLQIFIAVTSGYRNCEDPSHQAWIFTLPLLMPNQYSSLWGWWLSLLPCL